jgi:tetraprenyl-beta-curcumene synthase
MASLVSRAAIAATFVAATWRYWLGVFPLLMREANCWQARAMAGHDPVLRGLALDAQQTKRRSLDGAVAFAAFGPRRSRARLVRALTAYQIIFDYLDTVSEQPSVDPIANGRRLNQALLTCIDPQGRSQDYYVHHTHRDDGGYMQGLVNAAQAAFSGLASHAIVTKTAQLAAVRIREYQSLNHGDTHGSRDAFCRWARLETYADTDLRWWEAGAAAGSSTTVLVLVAAAANPALGPYELAAIADAYCPWIAALHTLLDSLVDQQEDIAEGNHSLIDYYSTPQMTAARLAKIAAQALEHTRALPNSRHHALILAAMASFYLSDPHAHAPHADPARRGVLATMGDLAAPTMLVFRIQRMATRFVRRQNAASEDRH